MRRTPPRLVFAGPTLAGAAKGPGDDVIVLPPAAQGHVVSAVQYFRPDAMLIIDGMFQSEPAIRHKELLWAMAQGVTVLGAASMGAIRAAELFPHMIGVGLIYRWFRRWPLAADDAVAVTHAPEEAGFAQTTEALVDARMAAKLCVRQGLLSPALGRQLSDAMHALGFRDRTWRTIVQAAFPHWEECRRLRIEAVLQGVLPRQKQRDAVAAVDMLRQGTWPQVPRPAFEVTRAFELEISDGGFSLAV